MVHYMADYFNTGRRVLVRWFAGLPTIGRTLEAVKSDGGNPPASTQAHY